MIVKFLDLETGLTKKKLSNKQWKWLAESRLKENYSAHQRVYIDKSKRNEGSIVEKTKFPTKTLRMIVSLLNATTGAVNSEKYCAKYLKNVSSIVAICHCASC